MRAFDVDENKIAIQEVDGPAELPRRVHWIGAVSFEDRCSASLLSLTRERGIALVGATILDYPTTVYGDTGEGVRRRNLEQLKGLCDISSVKPEVQIIHPYRSAELTALLRSKEHEHSGPGGASAILVDLTCLTKVHKIVCAKWAHGARHDCSTFICHTKPEAYLVPASLGETTRKWRDILLAPISDAHEQTGVEGSATGDWVDEHEFGVLLLGHDAARTRAALAHLEPDQCLVLVSSFGDGMEKEAVVSRTEHADLLERVRIGQLPGWSVQHVNMLPVDNVMTVTRDWSASVGHGRRVLFPFGPGPLVFGATLGLLNDRASASWFVYPVPESYPADYSRGVGSTTWWSVRRTGN